jgi:hypothetical protein
MISNEQKLICCIGLVSFVLGTVVSLPEIYSVIEFQKAYSLISPRQNSPQSILLLNNTAVNKTSSTAIIGSNNIVRAAVPAFNTTQFQNQHQSQPSGYR